MDQTLSETEFIRLKNEAMNVNMNMNTPVINTPIVNTPTINTSISNDSYVKFENFNKTIDEFEKLHASLIGFENTNKQKAKSDKSLLSYVEQTDKIVKSVENAINTLKDERYKHLVDMAKINVKNFIQ